MHLQNLKNKQHERQTKKGKKHDKSKALFQKFVEKNNILQNTNTVTFAELKETFRQLKPSNNTTICLTTISQLLQ